MKWLTRRRGFGRAVGQLVAIASLWGVAAAAVSADEPVGMPALRSPVQTISVGPASRQLDAALLPLNVVRLPAVEASAINTAQAKGWERFEGKPVPVVGLCRDVYAQVGAEAMAQGEWLRGADGRWEWRLLVNSPEAHAVRLYLRDVDMPRGAALFVQGEDRLVGPFFERGPNKTGEFWTPSVKGETAQLIYRLAVDGVPTLLPPFDLAQVGHIFKQNKKDAPPKVGDCQIDLACHAEWADVGTAVGMMRFTSGRLTYQCSGVLLNNAREDFAPYFLTAHHCVSTQDEAQSVEVFWYYQTGTCDGTPPDLEDVPSTIGATLLATAPYWEFSDVTLLRLRGDRPDGLTYAGWTTEQLTLDQPVVGIHHPDGSFKRICFGSILSDGNPDRTRAAVYWLVLWQDGVTEPGSSGSPLFNEQQQVVGQLYGGSASCQRMDQPDYYGKFAAAYPFLAPFLDPDAPDVDDEFEENDVAAEAAPIDPGTYGELMLLDDDWYQLTVLPFQEVRVQIVFNHQVGDLDLAIYDEQMVQQAASASTQTNSENVELAASETARTYWIKVFGFEGATAPYAMTIQIGQSSLPPMNDDEFEENDSAFTATAIDTGEYPNLAALDEDWYRLEAQPGWEVSVRIEFNDSDGDLDMILYDHEFNELERSDSTANFEQVSAVNLAKSSQTYFVLVYGYAGATNSYTMKASVGPRDGGIGCGQGVGLGNLAMCWCLCLAWLVSQKARTFGRR